MPGRVTCIGAAALDRKLYLHAPPRAGTSNPARMAVADGGVARNVAETLARLGVEVAIVSRVGDDETGRGVLANLAAVGVDTSGVVAVPGAHTAEYVAVLAGGALVLGVAAMDLLDGMGVGDLHRGWPPDGAGDWVFIDCNCPEPVLGQAVARARAGGARLAVDAVSTPKVVRLPADLTGISLLFCNTLEARRWLARASASPGGTGADPAADAPGLAAGLRAAGAAAVVLTDGPGGVAVVDVDGLREVPTTPATPIDETGAGDALVAGALAGLLAGRPLVEAVAAGTAVAALTVESERTVRPDLSPGLVERAAARRGPTGDSRGRR
jgi:sugar/nucleoside kinase (ribokinase family)